MKKTILCFLAIFLTGCTNEKIMKDVCNPDNPFEMKWMTDWIADLQNCVCTVSVFQAEFEGDPVFWALMTDPLCQGAISEVTVYNCDGSKFMVLNNFDELAGFQGKVKSLKIIYQCSSVSTSG